MATKARARVCRRQSVVPAKPLDHVLLVLVGHTDGDNGVADGDAGNLALRLAKGAAHTRLQPAGGREEGRWTRGRKVGGEGLKYTGTQQGLAVKQGTSGRCNLPTISGSARQTARILEGRQQPDDIATARGSYVSRGPLSAHLPIGSKQVP